jgi:hypothetical protein
MKSDLSVARAWLRLQQNWWAFDELSDACSDRPHRAWRLIRVIARLTNSSEMIRDLGCGPLEDLIENHAPRFIGQIERECATNPRLRRAISSVWLPQATDIVSRRLYALGCRPLKVKLRTWQSKKRGAHVAKRTKIK